MASVLRNYKAVMLRPSMWQFVIDQLPMMGLVILCCLYAGLDGMPLRTLAMIIACIVSVILMYQFHWYQRLSYRITGEQIIIRKGVFTRCCDYIELYRVVDFHEHRSFMQQIMGLKTVSIYSGDRTTPRLDLIGMKRNNEIVQLIRDLVEINRQRKGIYEITNR